MHTIRANGHTSRTLHPPLMVAIAISAYVAGQSIHESAAESDLPPGTVRAILHRHDLIRSKTEAMVQYWINRGKASQVARRRLIEREYSRFEAHDRRDELADHFDVHPRTIRRDLEAIGYGISRAEAAIQQHWGSFAQWQKMQRRAALLVRHRGWTKTRARKEIGCTISALNTLLDAYDERKDTAPQPA